MNRYATTQGRVLAAVTTAGRYRCLTIAEQRAALKLNGKGLIRRDAKDGKVWYSVDIGRRVTLTIERGEVPA